LVYCTFYGYYTGELLRPAGVSSRETEQSLNGRSTF